MNPTILLFRPNGASHASPGQRPGSSPTHHPGALKGRPNRGIISRPAPPLGPPFQGLGCRGAGIPGALPQAGLDAAPLGLWNQTLPDDSPLDLEDDSEEDTPSED
jgi:hypothetical protein